MLIYKIHAIFCLPSIVLAYDLLCPDRSQREIRSQGLCTKQNDTKTLYTCLEDVNKDTYNESCSEKEDFVRAGRRFVYVGLATDRECSAKRYQPIRFYKSSGAMCLFLKSTCNEVGQMVSRKGSSLSDTTCICDYTEGYAYVTRPSDPCNCVPSKEDCSCYEKLCPENQLLSADYECIHRNASNVTTCDTVYKSETNITTTTSTTVTTDSTAFNESPTRVKYAVDAAVSITVMIFFILLEAIFLSCIITMRMGAQNGQHIIEYLPGLPADFQNLSDKDKEHYLRIIKSGTETRYDIRIVIIGENGVGKTCLLRRLLGESIEGVTSTDGVDVDNKFKIRLSDGQWIIDKVANNTKNRMTRIKKIKTRLEQLVTEKDELVNCRIWDFSGSRLFYPAHQIFSGPNAVHLLVADIRKDVKLMNTEGGYDNIDDYIHFWFNRIYSYSKCTEYSPRKLLDIPVIVVCTGIDRCGDKLEERKIEFEKQLQAVMDKEGINPYLRRTCYVSNIEPSDEDFDCLRQSIFEFGKNTKTFKESLPVRWIHLEQELDRVRGSGYDIYDCSEMEKLASSLSFQNNNELSLFLKYHHTIGNIIFFETLQDHIVLNPKWLADAFKCFISDKYSGDLKSTQEWKTFEDTGELKPQLIDKLLQKEPERNFVNYKNYLLEIMEEFGMIAKISPKGQMQAEYTYYMPCMVNKKIVDVFGEKKDEYTPTPWLCIQFNFMPFDFLNYILCHYIREYSLCTESSSGRVALYHGMGVFYLDDTKSNKLILCFFKNTIAMQIWQFTKLKQGKCRSMLEELMFLIKIVIQDKFERRWISHTVKVKCADGNIHIAAGWKRDKELTDVSKKYFCEEHRAMHDTSDFLQTWFEKNSENMAIEMTEELEDNFFRIIKLVYGVAPQAVRKMFDKNFPPIRLATILNQKEDALNVLVEKNLLTTTQMKLLFPETGFTSSSNFDVILMICLLRNLSSMPHPVMGFDVLPHSIDTSEGADLARVKYYTNKIASSAIDRLTKSEFTTVWNDLEQALLRLGGSEAKAMCDVIKNKTFK